MSSPTAAAADPKIAVTGLNVSKHGLAFSIDCEVAVGAYFKLGLPSAGGMEREILILHCKPLQDGRYNVGAEFA